MRSKNKPKIGQRVKVMWFNTKYTGTIAKFYSLLDVDDTVSVRMDHSNHMIPYRTSDLIILEDAKTDWIKYGF